MREIILIAFCSLLQNQRFCPSLESLILSRFCLNFRNRLFCLNFRNRRFCHQMPHYSNSHFQSQFLLIVSTSFPFSGFEIFQACRNPLSGQFDSSLGRSVNTAFFHRLETYVRFWVYPLQNTLSS